MYNSALKANADWVIAQCVDSEEYKHLEEKVESAKLVVLQLREEVERDKTALRGLDNKLKLSKER
jgi:hypothetical protein